MIAYIDNKDFIDCTARSLNIRTTIPLAIENKTALIIRPSGYEFIKLPGAKINKNILVNGEISLSKAGVRIKDTVVFNNYFASYMREWWRDLSKAELNNAMKAIVGNISQNPQINNYSIHGLLDADKPLTLNIDYTLKDSQLSQTTMHRVPELWTSYFLNINDSKNRTHSFKTTTPLDMSITRSINKVKLVNSGKWQRSSNPANVSGNTEVTPQGVIQKIHYKRKRGLWEAKDFKPYNDVISETINKSLLIIKE